MATKPAHRYVSIAELAEILGWSPSTVKSWPRLGKFPAPDAVLGGLETRNRRLWDRDRVLALIIADSATAPFPDSYDWTVTPTQYLSSTGVADLLRVSANTIKFWLRDPAKLPVPRWTFDRDRSHIVTLPDPDIVTAWGAGWTEETLWNWWNNTHPTLGGARSYWKRSATYLDFLDGQHVAVCDFSGSESLQVRPADMDSDTIDYVSAATVLIAATGDPTDPATREAQEALNDDRPGCWFVPGLTDLTDTHPATTVKDYEAIFDYLGTLPRPTVVFAPRLNRLPPANRRSDIRYRTKANIETLLSRLKKH